MNRPLARWGVGIAASLAAHALAIYALMVALRPDPVTEQPMPAGELDVQAYQLDRSQAQERPPPTRTADTQSPKGAAVEPGAIRQSIAKEVSGSETPALKPATPSAEATPAARPATRPVLPSAAAKQTVAAARPVADKVDRVAVQTDTLTARRAPRADSPELPLRIVPAALAAAQAPRADSPALPLRNTPVTLAAARAQPAKNNTPEPDAALPVTAAKTAVAPQTPPREAATGLAPDTQAAQPSELPATQAAFRVPDTETVKAMLAFPGGTDGVDPVSLAAFQNFMQPGDFVSDDDPLRDGIAALLGQVPCSRLQVVFNPDTVALEVRGHIPEAGLQAPVLAALRDRMGADITVSDNILILPRPQCGALAGIGNVGLPQSTDQITNPLLVGEDTHARVLDFVRDDRLWFDITAPDYDAFVYVDFFDAGGNVLHLVPNDRVPLRKASADSALRIGTKNPDEQGLGLIVGPPYGQEIAVAFAASHKLYDGLRPVSEPAAPYLEWLASRVRLAREKHAGFKGEWVYFFVTTAER